MFTGIIEAVGGIGQVESNADDKRFEIKTGKLGLGDVKLGDSICVNGVCLTVVELNPDGFMTDVSIETLSCTTFDNLQIGDPVNLEKALQVGDRLGGHMVSGHVDDIGKVTEILEAARSNQYWIELPGTLMKYVCKKGSICIDGVSLTVNEVKNNNVSMNIIPHTLEETIFNGYKNGSLVNIEVDIIARYLEGLTSTSDE